MKKIKLIAIDMDGTLFDDNGHISKTNIEAIAKARAQGIKVVIASGRQINGVIKTLKELNLFAEDDFTICYNGALIVNNCSKTPLYCSHILGKDVKRFWKDAMAHGLTINAYMMDNTLISPDSSPFVSLEAKLNGASVVHYDFDKLPDDVPLIKCMLAQCKEKLDAEQDFFINKYASEFTTLRSHDNFFEILNKESSKGTALMKLAGFYSIPLDQCVAFGDNLNDIPMLSVCGYKVAMGNAGEQVKKASNIIAPSNNDSGVGIIINELLS